MAIHLLEGLFLGMRNSQELVGQRQQLLALGGISAGLTHELNNPAAAAVRANAALKDRVAHMRRKLAMLAHDEIDPRLLELLVDVQEEAVLAIASAPRADRGRGVASARTICPTGSMPTAWPAAGSSLLSSSAPARPRSSSTSWPRALRLTCSTVPCAGSSYTLETELLLGEITDSVTRISNLLGAAKQYSHMDRAPFERADIHDGLKSTLSMMAGKLDGLTVVKELDRSLPPVPIYGGELNQVWTNLIDNAVQAMNGTGTLTIRTSLDGDYVAGGDRRHRPGHPRRAAAAHLRAVLHDQAGRPGHRARPGHLLSHRRRAPRRRSARRVAAGRHPFHRPAAAHGASRDLTCPACADLVPSRAGIVGASVSRVRRCWA